MEILFPVSGVEAPIWLPPLVALVISFFTSMGGVSGAFLLLPFQMSVLGFVSPAVSATNMVFNIVAIPGGVYKYLREGRMVWPLMVAVVAGTLPGVLIGVFVRLTLLADPRPFKAFVGVVLIYIGVRLVWDVLRKMKSRSVEADAQVNSDAEGWNTETISVSWKQLSFSFRGQTYSCSTGGIATFSLLVGVVGGAYGIGGGAIVAPVFVTLYGLPVHAVAGATLMGTFTTSIVGVIVYQFAGSFGMANGLQARPDWLLGILFGIGGLVGMYLGARVQKYVPSVWLKLMLGSIVLFVAVRYVLGYLLR